MINVRTNNTPPDTIDDLGNFLISEISKEQEVTGLTWDLRWAPHVSNSHSAPKGYPTNFSGDTVDKNGIALPSGFPGWYGRIWIRFDSYPKKIGASDLLRNQRVYTGTGGYGTYDHKLWAQTARAHYLTKNKKDKSDAPVCFSWDCKIFDYDWPTIQYHQEKMRTWELLAEKTIDWRRHSFDWTDEKTIANDKIIIASAQSLVV